MAKDTDGTLSSQRVQLESQQDSASLKANIASASSCLANDPLPERYLSTILSYLHEHGYEDAEAYLRKNLNLDEYTSNANVAQTTLLEKNTHLNNLIGQYDPEKDGPEHAIYQYESLYKWINSVFELFKDELTRVLYPLFVHTFLHLLERGFASESLRFFQRHRMNHMTVSDGSIKQREHELNQLEVLTTVGQVHMQEQARLFLLYKIECKMSSVSYQLLMAYLDDRKFILMIRLLHLHVNITIDRRLPLQPDQEGLQLEKSSRAMLPKIVFRPEKVANINKSAIKFGVLSDYVSLHESAKALVIDKKRTEMLMHRSKRMTDQQLKLDTQPPIKQKKTDQVQKDDRLKPTLSKKQLKEQQLQIQADETVRIETENKELEDEARKIVQIPMYAVQRTPETRLPKLSDIDADEYIQNLLKRARLSATNLPSICFYGFLNSKQSLNSLSISNDGALVSSCYLNSTVRVWNLADYRGLVDMNTGDTVSNDMPTSASIEATSLSQAASFSVRVSSTIDTEHWPYWKCIGHSASVTCSAFSFDNRYMLTAGHDCTARLWHVPSKTQAVVYRGHDLPIWDVCFCPLGFYFATASHDHTARLWSTDKVYPLRIFCGHLSDVDVVRFHPNSLYLATGSSDRTIRLWDIHTGETVRLFVWPSNCEFLGHGSGISALAFHPEGNLLATGDEDGKIILWDISSGRPITVWSIETLPQSSSSDILPDASGKPTRVLSTDAHLQAVTSLDFNSTGRILASGSVDSTIKVWDIEHGIRQQPSASWSPCLRSFPVHSTHVTTVRFSTRDVLLAGGVTST